MTRAVEMTGVVWDRIGPLMGVRGEEEEAVPGGSLARIRGVESPFDKDGEASEVEEVTTGDRGI